VDANLGTPSALRVEDEVAIADGTSPARPSYDGKSTTGGVGMLGGGPIEIVSARQHLKSPDSTTSEIVAAGTICHRIYTVRGLLHEMRIRQDQPTPLYCDSQSTVFVANDASSIKRSVWISRRAQVLREAVDERVVAFMKIPEADNVADGFTKVITNAVMNHHAHHIHPQGDAGVIEGLT
jgi:hypothetical protein